MNKDFFLRYIEETRDCESGRLSAAVGRGIRRAKKNAIDSGKILALAAACLCAVTVCFTVNLRPFKAAVEDYYRYRNFTMPVNTDALNDYFTDIAVNAKKYLGGE